MASNRRRIIEAVAERLAGIRTAYGYATEAGALLFVNAIPNLGPDDPPAAIALLVDDDQVVATRMQVELLLPLTIAACARGSYTDAQELLQAWLVAEDVLADVKRAIETADRQLGLGRIVTSRIERSTTRTIERQEGSDVVGVQITYVVPYVEVWGGES